MADKTIFEMMDVDPDEKKSKEITKPIDVEIIDENSDDFDRDFEQARRNMLYVMETAQTALEDIHVIAKEKESERGYEALNNLLRTVSDTSAVLMKMYNGKKAYKKKEIEKSKEDGITVNGNAVFTGSTSDLRKMLRGED